MSGSGKTRLNSALPYANTLVTIPVVVTPAGFVLFHPDEGRGGLDVLEVKIAAAEVAKGAEVLDEVEGAGLLVGKL